MKIRTCTKAASLLPLIAISSCSADITPTEEEADSVTIETARITPAANATALAVEPMADPAADAALRRAYGPADLHVQKCMKLEKNGTLLGENCSPGWLVFGPYVRIPKGASIRLNFDVESPKKIKISSDIVSSAGQVFHGSMDEQVVDPKTVRNMGYGLHMFQAANAAEARIWVASDGPASFKITNLKLVVQ